MIGSTSRQASLFYFALAKEAMAITDDVLDPLDPLLQDPQLVQVATQALAKRRARRQPIAVFGVRPMKPSLRKWESSAWSCRGAVGCPSQGRLAKKTAGSAAARAGGLASRRASARSSIALECCALTTKERPAL